MLGFLRFFLGWDSTNKSALSDLSFVLGETFLEILLGSLTLFFPSDEDLSLIGLLVGFGEVVSEVFNWGFEKLGRF